MRPYYEQDGVTIYHGDCREFAPALCGVDVLLADPPYGIQYVHSGGGKGRHTRRNSQEPIKGDTEAFDPQRWLTYPRVLLWGADHFAAKLPVDGTWLAWDKSCGIGPADSFADAEFAWTNVRTKRNVYRYLWKGIVSVKDGEANGHRWHPMQKPVGLMQRCLVLLGGTGCVLDPYMGSGTVPLAAKMMGMTCIGIEIEERYCEIAARRLSQGVLDFGEVCSA